jgi:hypothetical protein
MGNAPVHAHAPPPPSAGGPRPRAELVAGLSFLEASRNSRWSALGVREWFDEHLVQPGLMMTPVVVTELAAGTAALHGTSNQGLTSQERLPRVLTTARIRVLTALRGLLASPVDDRFLMTAIFNGRVRRVRIDGANRWVVRPEPTATLSSIVLSLFAADVLSNRETYDRSLCVCEMCDRVTFEAGTPRRTSCPDHRPSVSGFIRKVTIAQDPQAAEPWTDEPSS